MRVFREQEACVNIHGTLAIVPRMPMMAGTLVT